jgi:S-layer homology domain
MTVPTKSANTPDALTTQATLTLDPNKVVESPVYTIANPVTTYVCPQIVQAYTQRELVAIDIPATEFSDDIRAMIMFRGLEQNEAFSGQTYTEYKKWGIAINDEFFEPTRSVTRAEYVKMLVRALSCRYTYMGTDSGFDDVDKKEWYAEYITFGVKNGWMNGYSDGGFHPDAPISRAEAAKILTNAIRLQVSTQKVAAFSDVAVGNSFAPYIAALKDNNIITGKTKNRYHPDDQITRAEVSRLIYKTFLGGQSTR